jgi:MoxR domain in the MoxR-vWA-beta-propeller ternary systems
MKGDLGNEVALRLSGGSSMHKQINQLRADLMAQFPERKDVIDGALAAVLAGEHVLLIGPPGTAKSALVRCLARATARGSFSGFAPKEIAMTVFGVRFRGKGHERLVSRRWLEHGPWLVRRIENDTTCIQFHDADADVETAWAQTARAHDRMGISHIGGYLQHDYVFHSTIGGLYKAADRTLTIVRSGEPLEQVEMLDLCALRAQMRAGAKPPIDRVRVLFMEERDARRYLHELWLRELECWCIDAQGREVRLDDGYQPERIVPEWVERVEGRAPRVASPQVQLSLGLASLLADPEGDLPGDWNRDELLLHILDWMEQETRPAGYEVREVLGARLSRLVKKAGETGDLVVRAFDDVGGAMAADQAAPLLARARAVRPQVELPFDPERLGLSLPAIIVPDPYPRQQPIKFGQGHPLDGVIVHQVSDVLARVRSLNREDLRDTEALLRLCADDRFVLSATSRVTATP